jgi:hypothetical protein
VDQEGPVGEMAGVGAAAAAAVQHQCQLLAQAV